MTLFRRSACMTLALLGLSFIAPAAAQDPSTRDSTLWELKGLKLGATIAEVQAALPRAKCETEAFDSGLTVCKDASNSLAGSPAIVRVKFLDGFACFIDIGNIDVPQAEAAAAALTAKFGPATTVEPRNGFETRRLRERRLITPTNEFTWNDGETFLSVVPFSWTNDENGVTYAAVVLFDKEKHERQWLVRYTNEGRPLADI